MGSNAIVQVSRTVIDHPVPTRPLTVEEAKRALLAMAEPQDGPAFPIIHAVMQHPLRAAALAAIALTALGRIPALRGVAATTAVILARRFMR